MKTIEELIKELFEILPKHYSCMNKSVSESEGLTHIIYPKTRQGKMRISEQEAKQIFIQLLEREGYTYSVETPTLCHKYRFSGTLEENKQRIDNKNGQSGNIDVSIYEDITKDSPCEKFLCHIEFKANKPDPHDIKKDILKLYNEATSSKTNYFIHVLESVNKNTPKSLLKKYQMPQETTPNIKVVIAIIVLKTGVQKILNFKNLGKEGLNDLYNH
jgi:hypothetical protein